MAIISNITKTNCGFSRIQAFAAGLLTALRDRNRAVTSILSIVAASHALAGPDTIHDTTLTSRDGVILHVAVTGDERKPTILFIHDAGQSHSSWAAQFKDPALAQHFRLVALDIRGHGASGKPLKNDSYAGSKPWGDDVRAVIDELGLHDVVLVGASFGSQISSAYVTEYGTASLSGIVMLGGLGGLLGGKPDAMPSALQDPQSLTVPEAIRAARSNYSELSARIDVPMLIIAGARDASFPPSAAKELASRGSAAQVVRYSGVGGLPVAEAAAKFNADLKRFAELATSRTALGVEDARILAASRTTERFRAALAGDDAETTQRLYAEEIVMERNRGRPAVRGRDALRPTDEFHAVVRPRIRYIDPKFTRSGERVVLSTAGSVEATRLFESMGLPVVTTMPIPDALVIENDKIVSMREAEFRPACQAIISHATSSTLEWLRASGDPRLEKIMPSGVPRIGGDTASTWVEVIRDWGRSSAYKPDPAQVAECVRLPGPPTTSLIAPAKQ